MGNFYAENRLKPNVYVQVKNDDVNQSVFYSNSIESQVSELQQTIESYCQKYKKVFNQLEDQEKTTQKLQRRSKKVQRTIKSHNKIYKNLSSQLKLHEATTVKLQGKNKNFQQKIVTHEQVHADLSNQLDKLETTTQILQMMQEKMQQEHHEQKQEELRESSTTQTLQKMQEEIQRTQKTIDKKHEELTNLVKEQNISTSQNLQTMHENIQGKNKLKSDLEQELMNKLKMYEEEGRSLQLELQKLSEFQTVLTERLDCIEQVNKDFIAEINQHSNRLMKQEILSEKLEKQYQKVKQDDLVQQLDLQKIDHDDLLQKVKKNEEEQKKIKESFKELVDITSTISTQISDHEKVQLELFTKLNQLQSAGSNQPKKPISLVNSKMTHHPPKIERSE